MTVQNEAGSAHDEVLKKELKGMSVQLQEELKGMSVQLQEELNGMIVQL